VGKPPSSVAIAAFPINASVPYGLYLTASAAPDAFTTVTVHFACGASPCAKYVPGFNMTAVGLTDSAHSVVTYTAPAAVPGFPCYAPATKVCVAFTCSVKGAAACTYTYKVTAAPAGKPPASTPNTVAYCLTHPGSCAARNPITTTVSLLGLIALVALLFTARLCPETLVALCRRAGCPAPAVACCASAARCGCAARPPAQGKVIAGGDGGGGGGYGGADSYGPSGGYSGAGDAPFSTHNPLSAHAGAAAPAGAPAPYAYAHAGAAGGPYDAAALPAYAAAGAERPLPPGWERFSDETGDVWYSDEAGNTRWDRPT